MQSVKSREDGKRLPEHFNSMISKLLSKWRRRSSWFSGSYKVSRNQPFLLPCAFLMQWFFEWVGGSGGGGWQKKYKSLKMSKKKFLKCIKLSKNGPPTPHSTHPCPLGGRRKSWFLGFGPIKTTFAKDTFSFKDSLYEKSTWQQEKKKKEKRESTYNVASQPPERRSTATQTLVPKQNFNL